MGIKTMSLLQSATSVAASGGSAVVFSDDGQTITNGVHLVVPADADYQTRRQATFKFRPPTLTASTGVYSKDKKSASFVIPQVLTTGQVVFNTIRVEREVHPSCTAANATELNRIGAQLLTDADTDAFWSAGSLT